MATDDDRLVRLVRAAGEDVYLMSRTASEGSLVAPTRARALLRQRFFARDSAARSLRRIVWELAQVPSEVDEREAWDRFAGLLARGHVQVRAVPTSLPTLTPGVRIDPPAPPLPPVSEPEPVVVEDRALMLTRCDPELESGESLDYSYLIRSLPSATLRISSDSFPGNLVHEAQLGPAEIEDGVHEAQWDGIVTVGGEHQNRRLRPGFSPARLEIIHDEVYCDAATFTIAPLRVHAIDIEDAHFNFDRSVLLPDIASVDGSEPTLDDRRITGLGVIYAALVHAGYYPEQKLLVIGHADPSGAASYNQTLSEKRAQNVQLFLFGDRDGWRNQSDAEAHTDDIQRILAWQAARAGWDCDPGPITGTNNSATRRAIGRFQERYNVEVQRTADEGLDLPYRATIGVDDTVGPETWGAFFDVYMHELMRLLRVEGVAEVEAKIAALVQFDSLPKFIGCGEHVPFAAGRREPFADDDERERPQRSPSDRRVELLFFDDDEEPNLVCHAGGAGSCDPTNCPIYTTGEYRHFEIGVPRGLQIAEVVIDLMFEDPAGVRHPLPAGLELTVTFDDESTQTHTLEANARLQFVVARNKSSFGFALAPGEDKYIVMSPGPDGGDPVIELLGRDDALAKVDEGGRFFKLPAQLDSSDCEWRVPDGVVFEDGEFTGLDNPDTQIGTRVAPAQVVLAPRWQHFRFEYHDRWRGESATLPQPRPASDGAPPLVLEGHLSHDYENGPTEPPLAESVWDLERGDATLHCLAWVQREVSEAGEAPPDEPPAEPADEPAAEEESEAEPESAPRSIPDADCLVRFVFPDATFVRTDGAAGAESATRTIEVIADGHAHREAATTACAERLRYYDLPTEWWSRSYHARLSSEGPGDRRHFQTITAPSTADDPYVVSLDDIVICLPFDASMDPFDAARGVTAEHTPWTGVSWEDDDEHRFTLWNEALETYKPMAGDVWFTDVSQLQPPPTGPVLLDHPPFCRTLTRGQDVFDIFELRSVRNTKFDGFPVGARVATAWREHGGTTRPTFSIRPAYESPRADETAVAAHEVGDVITVVLRCCGQRDGRELFRVMQYATAWIDFAPTAPPKGTAIDPPVPAADALAESRQNLIEVSKRWNGEDSVNAHVTQFEVGPADALEAIGTYHAVLVRAVSGSGVLEPLYHVNIVASVRASMSRNCAWERDDLKISAEKDFTAAHEWGHAFGNPDHYVESSYYASLWTKGINDTYRSAGCPYQFDTGGMMNGAELQPRGYDFWHLALWMIDAGQSFAGKSEIALRRGPYRFAPEVTPRNQDRTRFPVISKPNQRVGAAGLCDLFAYAPGVGGFNGGEVLAGASVGSPYELIIVCRVKMAVTLSETEHQAFEGGQRFLRAVERTIHQAFNDSNALVARGTYAGRSVRARVLFSPRFISRTFPTGTGTRRTDYLAGLQGTITNAASYNTLVTNVITQAAVHVEIDMVEDPDDHGITNATATPRRANLDTDDHEDEIVEIFGKLIGLSDPDDPEPNDYAPLLSTLAPVFTHSSLEFVG